jgi:hypothetical protein
MAVGRSGQRPDHGLDQPLGGKDEHLARHVGATVFSTNARRLIISSVSAGSPVYAGRRNLDLPTNRP